MKIVKDIPLPSPGDLQVELPVNSRPLWVGMKSSQPVMSVLINTDGEMFSKTVRVLAGEEELSEASSKSDYVGSFCMDAIIYHVVILAHG